MTFRSAIYRGDIVHERRRPKRHRLRYDVFTMVLDLDELTALDGASRLFGYNRFAPLAFYDRDHGPTDGTPLRPWVEGQLRDAGMDFHPEAIRIWCYPRVLGYVFNPLTVYFCHDRRDRLRAIFYEVCNTYKERHSYIIPVEDSPRPIIRQQCSKSLYVSPFIEMACTYYFRIRPPGKRMNIVIRQEDQLGLLLAAAFKGTRETFSDRTLAACIARFPLMTLKIIGAIHWEALRLWLKGLPVIRHRPATARVQAGIVPPDPPRHLSGQP